MDTDRIIEIRKLNNITQVKMAKILNCGYSTYNLWENNKLTIPLDKLNEFCNYFKISLDYIVKLTDENKTMKNTKLVKIEIGKRLYQTRISLKMTQEELASKLNYDQPIISKYENGISFPSTIYLISFSKLSGKIIDFFCNRIEEIS